MSQEKLPLSAAKEWLDLHGIEPNSEKVKSLGLLLLEFYNAGVHEAGVRKT